MRGTGAGPAGADTGAGAQGRARATAAVAWGPGGPLAPDAWLAWLMREEKDRQTDR